jgi:hypothetical protein
MPDNIPDPEEKFEPPDRSRDPRDDGHATEGPPPYKLVEEIVALSVANTWHDAKREWKLLGVLLTDPDDPGTCLCGHYPIHDHCVLRNRLNGNEVIVGNVCVTRFVGIPTGGLFTALRRIMQDEAAALSAGAVEYAYGKRWINSWERRFYLDTLRKKKLSPPQREKRVEINKAVLACATGGRHDA